MNKLTRIALALALLAVNGIAATNASAARGVSFANSGHGLGSGRYFPPEPTRRYFPPQPTRRYFPPDPIRRHARVIPAHPPGFNGNTWLNGPTCHALPLHTTINCASAGGTLIGGYVANGVHVLPYCVICD